MSEKTVTMSTDNPLAYDCDYCGVKAGEECTFAMDPTIKRDPHMVRYYVQQGALTDDEILDAVASANPDIHHTRLDKILTLHNELLKRRI